MKNKKAKNISGRSSSEFQSRNLNKEKIYHLSWYDIHSSAKNADTDSISVKALFKEKRFSNADSSNRVNIC